LAIAIGPEVTVEMCPMRVFAREKRHVEIAPDAVSAPRVLQNFVSDSPKPRVACLGSVKSRAREADEEEVIAEHVGMLGEIAKLVLLLLIA
jgi:hypothetical protein